jgi:hypothetical protein
MPVTQYIGSRYVPLFADPVEWSSTKAYEPLTIVQHQGNSYTSKQFVPVGIDIANTDFWAETGNYNAQIEQYRRETATALETALDAQDDIDNLLPSRYFDVNNTVKSYIDAHDLAVDPDMFEGTDVEKLEQAMDVIGLANGTILIKRRYTFTRNLLIRRRGNTQSTGSSELVNTRLTFVGIGADAIIDCDDYSIVAINGETSYGMLAFKDIAFTGGETFMNIDHIIRCNFDNCTFEKFDVCFTIPRFMQSYYFSKCTFRQIKCILFASGEKAGCSDVQLNSCLIERCYKVCNCYEMHGVTFNQCDIESCYDVCFTVYGVTKSFNVVNCYFEGNNDEHRTDISLPEGNGVLFDFTALKGNLQSISIHDNTITATKVNPEDPTVIHYVIDVGNYNASKGFLSLKGNITSVNMQLVKYAEGRTSKFTWITVENGIYDNFDNPKLFRLLDEASLAGYHSLSAGMDLDNLPYSGIWHKISGVSTSSIGHMPSGLLESGLVTLLHLQVTASMFCQILFVKDGIYMRNQPMTNWIKATTTNVPFVV